MAEAAPSVEEMLRAYLDSVKASINVDKIILFGSRARGDALKESDIDLMVVSKDFEGVPFVRRLELLALMWRFPKGLEALGYTPREYEELSQGITIVSEARKYGKVIYQAVK